MERKYKMVLSSIIATRRTMSRLAGSVARGEEDDYQRARLLLDICKNVLAAHKIEADLEIKAELADIRAALKAKGLL